MDGARVYVCVCACGWRARVCMCVYMSVASRASRACFFACGETPYILGVLDEGVYGEDGEVGVALGVIDEVEVHELFELHVGRLDAVDDVGEEHGHILADGHRRDHLLHRLLLLLLLLVVQLLLQLVDLACRKVRACSGVGRGEVCA